MGPSLTASRCAREGPLPLGLGCSFGGGCRGRWVQAPGAQGRQLLALLPPVGDVHTRGPGEGSRSAPTISASFTQSW